MNAILECPTCGDPILDGARSVQAVQAPHWLAQALSLDPQAIYCSADCFTDALEECMVDLAEAVAVPVTVRNDDGVEIERADANELIATRRAVQSACDRSYRFGHGLLREWHRLGEHAEARDPDGWNAGYWAGQTKGTKMLLTEIHALQQALGIPVIDSTTPAAATTGDQEKISTAQDTIHPVMAQAVLGVVEPQFRGVRG